MPINCNEAVEKRQRGERETRAEEEIETGVTTERESRQDMDSDWQRSKGSRCR